MKFKPNWASGFNLSWKGMLFESVDRQQTTMDKITISTILAVLIWGKHVIVARKLS